MQDEVFSFNLVLKCVR